MAYNPGEFVNRESEIASFSEVLNHPSLRLFFLCGPEGIGKTSVIGRLRRDLEPLFVFLFNAELDSVAQLDTEQVSSSLSKRFKDEGLLLGPEVRVKVVRAGDEWVIIDEDARYTIHREIEVLKVYGKALSVLVDFRDQSLDEPEHLLSRLQERIGGSFAEQLDRVGMDVVRRFSGEALSELLSQMGSAAIGRVDIRDSKEIQVEGDIVGGFKIVLNNSSITLPLDSPQHIQQAIGRRLNTVFPDAMQKLAARHGRVLLFFDHFEKAKVPIIQWMRHHLLNMHVEATDRQPDFWILIASRRLPYADETPGWRFVLHTQMVEPLTEEAVRLYWVEKRKLGPDIPADILQECGGNPLLLFWLAEDVATAEKTSSP